jgi:hypothetical protein
LELRGFTLSGGSFGIHCTQPCPHDETHNCSARCRVDGGGGTITAAENTAILADKVRVENVMIDGNGGRGIDSAGRAAVKDAIVTNNGGTGISGRGVTANRVTVTGNATGIDAGTNKGARVRNSIVTGNGVADIGCGKPPRVRNSECGRSFRPGGGNWGVCTFD